MGSAQDALNLARRFIGYREGPRANQSIFGAYVGANYMPWCGAFVKYVLDKSGTTGEPSPVYTPNGVDGYKRAGRWISRNGACQPGDVVFYDFGGRTRPGVDHVGFVEVVYPDGSLGTIEGNTSSSEVGSQSNGGGVFRRRRARSSVLGFGRPRYSGGSATPPRPVVIDWVAVRRMAATKVLESARVLPNLDGSSGRSLYVVVLQQALNIVNKANLAEDGVYGPATIQAVVNFQNNVNRFFGAGTVKDFPGAAHEFTRFWLCTQLDLIAKGKA